MFRLYAGYERQGVDNNTFLGAFESIEQAKKHLYVNWNQTATKRILKYSRLNYRTIDYLCHWAKVQHSDGSFENLKPSLEDLVKYNNINPACFFAGFEDVDKTQLKDWLVFAKIMNHEDINSEDSVMRMVGDFDTASKADKFIIDTYHNNLPIMENPALIAMYDNRPRKEPFTN